MAHSQVKLRCVQLGARQRVSRDCFYSANTRGGWQVGQQVTLQVRWINDHIQLRMLSSELAYEDMVGREATESSEGREYISPVEKRPHVYALESC